MRVSLDPFPQRKAAAVASVNGYCASIAVDAILQEVAWQRKRSIAEAVMAGVGPPGAFLEEAKLRGLTVGAFAGLILSKPDPTGIADARELQRQTALLAIDSAKTPDDLDAILANLTKV